MVTVKYLPLNICKYDIRGGQNWARKDLKASQRGIGLIAQVVGRQTKLTLCCVVLIFTSSSESLWYFLNMNFDRRSFFNFQAFM